MRLQNPFRVKLYGNNIIDVKPRYVLRTGITIEPTIPGIVPLLYEMEACDRANYQYFDSWQTLNREEKVMIVAKHMIQGQLSTHQEDARAAQAHRRSKTGGNRR